MTDNFAISYRDRTLVARALEVASADGRFSPEEAKKLRDVSERIDRPGPPVVSAADVLEVLSLARTIDNLAIGAHFDKRDDVLDHPWGVVRYDKEMQGYRIADPGETEARGNIRIAHETQVAREMYENHLRRRGLVP